MVGCLGNGLNQQSAVAVAGLRAQMVIDTGFATDCDV